MLYNEIEKFYRMLAVDYSEEEIWESLIQLIINGIKQKHKQYKNSQEVDKLLDIFYHLIELGDI